MALVTGAAYCHQCGAASEAETPDEDLSRRVKQLEDRLKKLTAVVDQHADVVNGHATQISALATRLKSSSLFSESFWSRAWAVVGHNLSVGLLIYMILFAVSAMVAGLFGG